MKNMTLRTWLIRFDNGEFKAPDIDTQIAAGWYDWFCKDSSLAGKTKGLGPKVVKIAKSPKVDVDKTYVFFKNNCPTVGSLYDDFRICDIKTGDVLYTVTPHSGHKSDKGVSSVWGKENDFEKALVEGTWDDVLKFFGVSK